MARVKRGVTQRARHKKILELAKGFHSGRSRLHKTANEAVLHSLDYAYRDRRNKKRDFHRLWIVRINAAARQNGLSYSRFMSPCSICTKDRRCRLARRAWRTPCGSVPPTAP